MRSCHVCQWNGDCDICGNDDWLERGIDVACKCKYFKSNPSAVLAYSEGDDTSTMYGNGVSWPDFI